MLQHDSFFNVPSYLLATILIVSIAHGVGLAHAEIISISLDKSCLTLLENNMSSSCPTYDEIKGVFANTPCGYKGDACLKYFSQVGIKNGYVINPDFSVFERVKNVVIRANFDEFKMPGSGGGYNNTSHSLTFGLGRFVDKCHAAYVDAKLWLTLTGDSIWYLNNNCQSDFTYHTPNRVEQLHKVEHDIATSYKYKLEQWQKQVIEDCGTKICLYEKNQTKAP